MSVDDTSQDSTLIDDDLVEALGFEPVTAPPSDGGGPSLNGSNGHGAAASVSGDAAPSNGITDPADGVDEDHEDVELKAEELLDVHREDVSLLADDDLELFDADDVVEDGVLDDDTLLDEPSETELADEIAYVDRDQAASVSAGSWADEDESIVLLNEDELTGAVQPVIDLDQQPIDLAGAPAESEVRDPYADYELATPASVFAESPTSAPPFEQTSVVPVAAAATSAGARVPQRLRRKKALRARKSRRVIRHIDPWSVLTFSVLFHMCVFAALLLGSVLVWSAATASGMVENVESFIRELGDYETFKINADVMFRAAVVVAGMLTLASSVLMVLLTVVFNLISDLVGGIRVTVIEEETVRVPLKPKTVKNVVAAPPPNG